MMLMTVKTAIPKPTSAANTSWAFFYYPRYYIHQKISFNLSEIFAFSDIL